MKKVLLFLTFCIIAASAAIAQNANRGGFFIEAAIGGTTGTTPRTSYGMVGDQLSVFHANGTAVNIAFGGRKRISGCMAYEFVVEAMAPTDAFKTQPVFKLMPVAFRYTSPEFYRNFSIYADIRLGGAIGNIGEPKWDNNHDDILRRDSDERVDVSFFNDGVSGGVAYEIGVGVNITTHFYTGFSWDAQYMFNQYRDVKKENLHWGMAGLRLGYRF